LEGRGYVVREKERGSQTKSQIGARVKEKKVKKDGFKLELHGLTFKEMSSLSIRIFYVCID